MWRRRKTVIKWISVNWSVLGISIRGGKKGGKQIKNFRCKIRRRDKQLILERVAKFLNRKWHGPPLFLKTGRYADYKQLSRYSREQEEINSCSEMGTFFLNDNNAWDCLSKKTVLDAHSFYSFAIQKMRALCPKTKTERNSKWVVQRDFTHSNI